MENIERELFIKLCNFYTEKDITLVEELKNQISLGDLYKYNSLEKLFLHIFQNDSNADDLSNYELGNIEYENLKYPLIFCKNDDTLYFLNRIDETDQFRKLENDEFEISTFNLSDIFDFYLTVNRVNFLLEQIELFA